MNLEQKIKLIQRNLEIGGNTIVAKECAGLIEQLLRQLFRQYLTYLDEKDRLKVLKAEAEIGKGEKGIESFTMGQLVGVFRTSRFLDAWARASGKDLSSLRVINFDELTKLRNTFIHGDREATRSDAEFLFNCLHVLLDTFDLQQLAAPEAEHPRRKGTFDLHPQKSTLGPLVSKMCNRLRHELEFWNFFLKKCTECPARPQFYILHGEELEGHESFIERLMKTRLKKYAEKEWGEHNASMYFVKVPWPTDGNLQSLQEILQMKLLLECDESYISTDYSASALARLSCLEKYPLIVIMHNIHATRWSKHDEQLIAWYVENYWGTLKSHDDVKRFLIFLNVKYPTEEQSRWKDRLRIFSRKPYSKERIQEQLRFLSKSLEELCPCLVLEELTAITIEDVKEWFSEYIPGDEFVWMKKIDAIFQGTTQKSMAEIEHELNNIIQDYGKEVIGW